MRELYILNAIYFKKKKDIFYFFKLSSLRKQLYSGNPALGMCVFNAHTYIGIFPTHEALHSSLFRHWPVDLQEWERGTFYSSSPKRYTSLAFIAYLD